jgi:hypothetical protein
MATLAVPVEEGFALTSRVTVVRVREEFAPGPVRNQEVRLAAPGREPLSVTVTGLEFLDDGLGVALVLCGAALDDVPPGTLIRFEWDWRARDEAGIRDALRRVLEEEGYRVTTAPGGESLCAE